MKELCNKHGKISCHGNILISFHFLIAYSIAKQRSRGLPAYTARGWVHHSHLYMKQGYSTTHITVTDMIQWDGCVPYSVCDQQILATWISLPQTCPQLTLSQIKLQIHIKICKWYSWKSYPLMGKLVYHWWYSYAPKPSHRVHSKGVGSYNHPVAQCALVAFTWNGNVVHSPTSGEASVLAHWQMKTFSAREN